ncbi:DUF2914 domain-containing protein [Winogradskyella costae]|uniref:DUF2914 domain-containing protein n=1 Tax=Winogradskyella costae TaxID=2697008 RepID=UPI0015CDAB6D|nr:DUF2914 domain-containing protein [Winogradskyella costae]
MKETLAKFREGTFRKFIRSHKKYAPIIFFIGGFIFDTLTLGRVDRLYDLIVLSLHMTSLTVTIYLFNVADDFKLKNSFLLRFKDYYPLAIQFFFGALSSAYVIYFSRSVSLSKTMLFFIILLILLFANEFLKKRISNKYLQFSVYFFINFTFFSFIIPVLVKEMNTNVFIFSGLISFILTLTLITVIFIKSPSTRAEIKLGNVVALVFGLYGMINLFYVFNLIPPVPLALEKGLVAHNIKVEDNTYIVTYETDDWYIFWRDHRLKFISEPNKTVYIFTSIFAPTDIEKSIYHRWKWYNNQSEEWETIEDIGYKIKGGRNYGYRGYTYKNNTKPGLWKVEVITEEELIIGVVDFELIWNDTLNPVSLIHKKF